MSSVAPRTTRSKPGKKAKLALMVVDDPNFNMQTLEALTPPDGEGPSRLSATTMIPSYRAMKLWFQQRHPDIETQFVIFTNLQEGKDQGPKQKWIKHLRDEGLEVYVNNQSKSNGLGKKTDVDPAMRKRIVKYLQDSRRVKLVEVIAVSHDARCFGGVGRRNEPGAQTLFDQLADLDIPAYYMGFEGLKSSPCHKVVGGVGYIDIGAVDNALPYDFPRYDLPVQLQPLPPPPQAPISEPKPHLGRRLLSWLQTVRPN